jgi:hypothetical protein
MTNILAGLAFGGFVLFGVAMNIIAGSEPEASRKRLVSLLIIYVIGATVGGVLLRRNLWPFSSWTLMQTLPPLEINDTRPRVRLVGVTADGVEHWIDYRVLQPWSYADLTTWMRRRINDLPPETQVRVGEYLLHKIERGRMVAIEGEPLGSWDRVFGRFSAPAHYFHRRRWSDAQAVPRSPFRAIRFYREYFNVEDRHRDPGDFELKLVFQYEAVP